MSPVCLPLCLPLCLPSVSDPWPRGSPESLPSVSGVVSEQIDALYVMSTRPIQYLVIPRVLAGLICLPFLVIIGDIIGIMGGWIIGVYQLGFNSMVYIDRTIEYLEIIDIFQCI